MNRQVATSPKVGRYSGTLVYIKVIDCGTDLETWLNLRVFKDPLI
jgi:hypothetical protein